MASSFSALISSMFAVAAIVVATDLAQAADPQSTADAASGYTPAPTTNLGSYFTHWFDRVDAAQASQPHWMTPLVTVTPRLEEEVRYDQYWEHLGNGANVDTYGSGKGLELIPTTTNEVLLNPPSYMQRYNVKPAAGWGDDPFLVVKQRLLSANEQSGNYIVTAFLGLQAPTGITAFTNDTWLITPTLAAGKGWGDFDIQGTIGVPIPFRHERTLGVPIVTNVAFQYHFGRYFWPEVEANYTYWPDGQRAGKNQLFLTPGLILGRFQVAGRLRLIIGGGYQIAVSPSVSKEPVLTPVYNNAWILTARAAF